MTYMKTMQVFVAAIAVVAMAGSASALNIINAGFEDPALADGVWGPPGSGWSLGYYDHNGTSDTTVWHDGNLDGVVNGLDVDPFVDVLLNGPFQTEADMNQDGEVNGLDVDSFVAAVVGGGTQQIPEPSTLLLVLVALSVVAGWRKWGG